MQLFQDRQAAVAIIFAAALVPILGLLGLGIDSALYIDAKERLNSWVEASCERVNSPAMLEHGANDRWQSARDLFTANAESYGPSNDPQLEMIERGSDEVLAATYDVPSTFGAIFGIDSYLVEAEFECSIEEGTVAANPLITLVVIDREGRKSYRLKGGSELWIKGAGGNAWNSHWMDAKVYRSSDQSLLSETRISNKNGSLIVPAQAASIVVEVHLMSSDWQNGKLNAPMARSCGPSRLCIEDSNQGGQFDWDDARYDFTTSDGESAFESPYFGDPYVG